MPARQRRAAQCPPADRCAGGSCNLVIVRLNACPRPPRPMLAVPLNAHPPDVLAECPVVRFNAGPRQFLPASCRSMPARSIASILDPVVWHAAAT